MQPVLWNGPGAPSESDYLREPARRAYEFALLMQEGGKTRESCKARWSDVVAQGFRTGNPRGV